MNKVNSNLGAPTIRRQANRSDPSVLRTRPKQMAWAMHYALQQIAYEAKVLADELRRWNALRTDGQRADGQRADGQRADGQRADGQRTDGQISAGA